MKNFTTPDGAVGAAQLKTLLDHLARLSPQTGIRLKIHGEPWPSRFSQVLVFTRHALVLAHMPTRTVTNVPDLSQVGAFELDRDCADFSAFSPYVVKPESTEVRTLTDGFQYA